MIMAGKVIFDTKVCKGCELCTTVCPKKIISMDRSKANDKGYNPAMVADMDQCTGCASCAKICPDSVITVERF